MNLSLPLRWAATPQEAFQIQQELAAQVVTKGRPDPVRWVAGVDASVREGLAQAAIAILLYPELSLETHVTATQPVRFPYVPGLLAFRELPPILEALQKLPLEPDVFLCDAQGVAHPRGLGLASHLGILINKPTIGCAKSRLYGRPAASLPPERGSAVPLLNASGQTVGQVVRTRAGVKPIYVSVGHKVELGWAVDFVLSCCRGLRLPEPTRQAHRLATLPRNTAGNRDV